MLASFVVPALLLVAGCADDDPAALVPVNGVPETVALGAFPEPLTSPVTIPPPPSTVAAATSAPTTEPPRDPITGPIGGEVFGNRLLVIGDTVIASTAPRFDGEMCAVLEAFGWQAEIAAEPGRFVEFGREVVDARIVPDEPEWDAAAVMLGNHFDGDVAAFRSELETLIAELDPRPVLLYTLVEDDTFQTDLNEVIRDLPRFHPNLVILDWAQIAADEAEVILADSPSGLSEEGRRRLALFTAAALGEPPTTEAAGCVPPVFVDDSAIVL
ncbi:MAG: hypothetical protein R8G01_05990 [Ilumatobacteraceae bacterium]|nr:hypothetical protein [Ilumatobacteraceae bacterium]